MKQEIKIGFESIKKMQISDLLQITEELNKEVLGK